MAHSLVASLDGPSESDVEEAWDAEILRRLAEIDSGSANLIDREEFGRRMRALRIHAAAAEEAAIRPEHPRRRLANNSNGSETG